MRISSINTNMSFKRVSTEAAKVALANSKNEIEKEQVKGLITKGLASTCYDVGYKHLSSGDIFFVYRNDENPEEGNVIPENIMTFSLEKAVDVSIDEQIKHNNTYYKTLGEDGFINKYTTKQTKDLYV